MLWQPENEGYTYRFMLPEGHTNENVMWLHWVVRLRWVAIIAQVITLAFTYKVLDSWGVAVGVALVALGLAFLNGHVGRALEREDDIDNGYVLGQLSIDVVALTVLFSLAGGPANPFVSLYFVHVAMGMIMLTAGRAVVLGVIIVLCFTSLFVTSYPLHLDRHGIPPHLLAPLGQWLAFVVSVFSVGTFVLGAANSLRHHQERARAGSGAHAEPAAHH